MENDFLSKITEIIEENLSNEHFGVSELAQAIGMSRSNLLRKVKKSTRLSVSQFIRQVRLKSAMEMLRQGSFNVSEISYKVGFSSTSYFIKCFHDHYGYPPGEVGKGDPFESDSSLEGQPGKKRINVVPGAFAIIILLAIVLFIFVNPFSSRQENFEKSIAVLPFINDSNDSTNVYLINGLMESILNNLQKIEDLRVVSRTSVEKFRNTTRTIPEIARELNVSYVVEGSGQKIGDQILLNIQMIEALNDTHVWSEQYNREANDIFNLQTEVAKKIADEIEVIITPEEEERIQNIPTENLEAYDNFLKGLDLFYEGNRESLFEAISYFEMAIELDGEFARAFADVAIAYYFLDIFQYEKEYSEQINNYADKALLLDPQLPQSLIAKALFYMNNAEYEMALPYLEKALVYNPNSALVINILSDFYTSYIPDPGKYLEYAIKGIGLDIAAHDSTTASYIYMHLSNAFIQSGFINEAEKYISKSLEYDPENLYSALVKAYVLFAKNGNLQQTKERLIETFQKDSTRLDIMQEVGKIYYYMRDYAGAYQYYQRFNEIRIAQNLDIFQYENDKIGVVLSEIGLAEEAEKYLRVYQIYAENDESVYKDLNLAMLYSYRGETEKALDHLMIFSEQDNYDYWVLIFVEIDPLVDNIKNLPEFKKILRNIENKFWDRHKRIKESLEEKRLL